MYKTTVYMLVNGRITRQKGGAEIARPDKTTPDQTARLNNGGHDYMTVL